jgi:holliday junction DNA helicase RuvA
MIGYLRGVVISLDPTGVALIDVQGVGYEVLVSSFDLVVGAEREIFIKTVVRDDAIVLFGFDSPSDREFFEYLVAVPGVGPTTAVGVLRTIGREELEVAISSGDVKRLTVAPGIGTKTAGRILLELRDKIAVRQSPTTSVTVPHVTSEALTSLGYSATEIREALRDVELPADEEAALRVALQRVSRR